MSARSLLLLAPVLALAACGEDDPAKGGDTGSTDTGSTDTGSTDTGSTGETDTTDPQDLIDACEEVVPLDPATVRDGGSLDGCYDVPSWVVVEGPLVIADGSVLFMGPSTGIEVRSSGSLTVAGTADRGVLMTGQDESPGSWMGVGLVDTESEDNVLSHLQVEHACEGAWTGSEDSVGGVFARQDTRLELERLTVRDCPGPALHVHDEQTNLVRLDGLTVEGVEQTARMGIVHAGRITGEVTDDIGVSIHLRHGDVTEATTLSHAYVVEDGIDVQAPLTIDPGVTLAFEAEGSLDVQSSGSLSAVGTAEAPILFMGAEAALDERGWWYGIRFDGSGSTDNALQHVIIAHAGFGPWTGADHSQGGLYLHGDDTRITVQDTRIEHTDGPGLLIDAATPEGRISVESTVLTENVEPVRTSANGTNALSADLVLSGNDHDRIRISQLVPGAEDITEGITWFAREVPYFVEDTIQLWGHLHIEPGTTVQFAYDQGLQVGDWPYAGGRLTAGERDEAPVVLTGAEEGSGYWRGIYFNQSADNNQLVNLSLTGAGSSPWNGDGASQAGIYLYEYSELAINKVSMSGNLGHDIWVDGYSRLFDCGESSGSFGGDATADICSS